MFERKKCTCLVAFLFLIASNLSHATSTEIVSTDSYGIPGNIESQNQSIDYNGRYIAFESSATNLVTNDNNGTSDIYVFDTDTKTIKRVSVSSSGTEANGFSQHPTISADGKYVVFISRASNLVANDTNGYMGLDIFVHNLETSTTERVSVDSNGTEGNGPSYTHPTINADGRYVAFTSSASNLTANDTNGKYDIFIHDRLTGATERVIDNSGNQSNDDSLGYGYRWISADGNYIVFYSYANNLVPDDTNNCSDIFLYERTTRTITRISVDSNGNQANGPSYTSSISADGRYIAFYSQASNLVAGDTNNNLDVFVHDRLSGTTELISVNSDGIQGNSASWQPSINADGTLIAFSSFATNLVTDDTNNTYDIFLHNRTNGMTERISIGNDDSQANGGSYSEPSISSTGRFVAFTSSASNLVSGDTNSYTDIFIRDRASDNDEDGYFSDIDCDDNNYNINPSAIEIPFNSYDEDCNGYDLTIDITAADYDSANTLLTVKATSSLGAAANLEVVGLGPMTYKSKQNVWLLDFTGPNPGSVTVSGPEGSDASTVTVQ